jgi:hypothetical protein
VVAAAVAVVVVVAVVVAVVVVAFAIQSCLLSLQSQATISPPDDTHAPLIADTINDDDDVATSCSPPLSWLPLSSP